MKKPISTSPKYDGDTDALILKLAHALYLAQKPRPITSKDIQYALLEAGYKWQNMPSRKHIGCLLRRSGFRAVPGKKTNWQKLTLFIEVNEDDS